LVGTERFKKEKMLSVTELELYQRVCELEGISFIECNKDILDLLKLTYSNLTDLREINKNNVKKTDTNFIITIDNFKKIEHSLKTLESKCDRNIHQFRKDLEHRHDLQVKAQVKLISLEDSVNDQLNRQSNVIILNYTISVICLLVSFFKLFF
jgi:hypothetical protein